MKNIVIADYGWASLEEVGGVEWICFNGLAVWRLDRQLALGFFLLLRGVRHFEAVDSGIIGFDGTCWYCWLDDLIVKAELGSKIFDAACDGETLGSHGLVVIKTAEDSRRSVVALLTWFQKEYLEKSTTVIDGSLRA